MVYSLSSSSSSSLHIALFLSAGLSIFLAHQLVSAQNSTSTPPPPANSTTPSPAMSTMPLTPPSAKYAMPPPPKSTIPPPPPPSAMSPMPSPAKSTIPPPPSAKSAIPPPPKSTIPPPPPPPPSTKPTMPPPAKITIPPPVNYTTPPPANSTTPVNSTTTTLTGGADYFITWDDMKIDQELLARKVLDSGDRRNQTRVIVVDQAGSGDSTTIQGAVDMIPDGNSVRVKIFILPGIYREKVTVPISKPYISFIGKQNESTNTVITWNAKASDKDANGIDLGTYGSATISVFSDFFCASEITFENTVIAKPGWNGMQAVALRVSARKAMFYRVNILGSQDTLLDDIGSHYFYQCLIQGSVDFIFGNARSLYQDSVLYSTADRSGAIAAHHRNTPVENTGFSFSNCSINGSGKIYLGRAWGPYSRVIYSYCEINDIITPEGWSDWNFPSRRRTAVFGEFNCRGKGADSKRRVSWAKSFNYEDVKPFLDTKFIDGDKWLRL